MESKDERTPFTIDTSKKEDDPHEEVAFQMFSDPATATKLIATDGDGAEEDSSDSFEFDMQPDDIYDLTVF